MEDGPRKVKLTPEQEVAKLERQLARAEAARDGSEAS